MSKRTSDAVERRKAMKIKEKRSLKKASRRRALIALLIVIGAVTFITAAFYIPPM